ncbi:MAG: peptidoglycan DD-metalloendopeptidase family protein [Lachnospirales bacterium]
MNKNDYDKRQPRKKTNFLKDNGLVIGLYAVVGALVVTAGALTVKNLNLTSKLEPMESTQEEYVQKEILEDSSPVSGTDTKSYLEQETGDIGIAVNSNVANVIESTKTNEVSVVETETTAKKEEPEATEPTENNTNKEQQEQPLNENVGEESKKQNNEENLKQIELEDDSSENYEDEVDLEVTDNEKQTIIEELVPTNNTALYRAFSDDSTMDWPIQGEVLMAYSNKLVYDQTLEQYKTNDTLRISANLGDKVVSSFDGEVIETGNSYNEGYYIKISHGNGWTSTYSQLDKSFFVAKGDTITKGQEIGQVSNPTRRYSTLNNHLGFKVTKNDETIDPTTILVKSN